MQEGPHDAFGRTIEVSSPDRVVFPDVDLTKADLLAFHERIAPTMLPHLHGRPVALKRYPEGIEGQGFFQKKAPEHLPDWVRRVDVPKREGGIVPHVVVEEEATILALVQYGTVELHPWPSRADDLERPDRIVIDLDPTVGDLDGARLGARAVRDVFEEIGLPPALMTSGSKGYHVVVHVEPGADFEVVHDLARDLATLVAREHPDTLTVEHRIDDRDGRVFLDWLRNGYGQTSVVPYGVRARPTAPVATPITWDELGSVDPQDYRIDNIFRRLGQRDDPWADVPTGDVHEARKALDGLLS
jgi:bifunctional non-homologous end joining protein LigD